MQSLEAESRPGENPHRYWFAETMVVLGILAFAYFAAMLESHRQQTALAPAAVVAAIAR